MKIKYEFANEVIEIEVSDEWGMIVLEMDRLNYNNDKKETRRHLSLDTGYDLGGWLMSDEYDPCRMMAEEAEREKVQSILSHLTKTQAEIVQAVCFEGMSITEFAKRKGISQPAASQRLMTAKKRLKKYL